MTQTYAACRWLRRAGSTERPMFALGQKRTFASQKVMSALPPVQRRASPGLGLATPDACAEPPVWPFCCTFAPAITLQNCLSLALAKHVLFSGLSAKIGHF